VLLLPLHAVKNPDYLKTLRTGLNIRLDEIFEQNTNFCEWKSTKGLIGDRQWDVNGNVSWLANSHCLSNFMIDESHKEKPSSTFIAKCLADLLFSKQTNKWCKRKSTATWIPNSINSLYHDVCFQFGKLAGDHNKQLDLLNGQMSNYEVCANIYNEHMTSKAIIVAGVQQSSIASFITTPGSWEHYIKWCPSVKW